MPMYFDFHFHPSLKSYLSDDQPAKREDCWVVYDNAISIVDSQGSLEQAWEGEVRLGVAVLYVLERPFTKSFLVKHVAPAITPLDKDMLDFPKEIDSFTRLLGEINHLKASLGKYANTGREAQIIQSIEAYDPEKINLILAIEGTHCLDQENTRVQDNFRTLKNGPDRFFYLNLTHLTRFGTCTHAYGIKLIEGEVAFKPEGRGLRPLGKEIIDIAYDQSEGHRILIDIKHMSLISRRDFYAYREEKGHGAVPIVASHIGLTGISWAPDAIQKHVARVIPGDELVEVKYKKPRGIGGLFHFKTEFNPWSVNLYDEEIGIILDSGGLIGLNLDKRILGAKKVDGEFFSREEYEEIFQVKLPVSRDLRAPKPKYWEEGGRESDPDTRDNAIRHLRHLCNQILHIVKVGGSRAWRQICMGSDFDGLIAPINGCISLREYPNLEDSMAIMLQQLIRESKKGDATLDYEEGSIKARVRDIMFNNAVRFLKTHYV